MDTVMTTTTTFELDMAGEGYAASSLYSAIKRRDPGSVLQAIYSGENVHATDPDFHSSYLHLVVSCADTVTEDRMVPVVYQLSNAGIQIDAADYKGQTALEIAIRRELQHMVAALLRVGADLSLKDYKQILLDIDSPFQLELMDTIQKYEPGLWMAVKNHSHPMVQLLVYSWCRINIARDGKTLLEYAQEQAVSQELLVTLDDFQVTMEFVHAALAGDEKRMLEFLMDSKPCDPYIMDISYQRAWSSPMTPRSLRDTAASMGHSHILSLLPGDNLDKDDDVKGYFGGVTLNNILCNHGDRGDDIRTTRTRNGSVRSSDSLSGTKSIGKVPSLGTRIPKNKPMKAFTPQPQLKTFGTKSPAPDVIAHNNNNVTVTNSVNMKLDLLNNASSDDQSYEQSRFTGSVALRSKTKPRKLARDAFSFTDDWSTQPHDEPDLDQSGQGNSEAMDLQHISWPQPASSGFHTESRDYSKNWVRSSLKASLSKSKSRSKEIRSKMCVIS